jgi:hypothetical protein
MYMVDHFFVNCKSASISTNNRTMGTFDRILLRLNQRWHRKSKSRKARLLHVQASPYWVTVTRVKKRPAESLLGGSLSEVLPCISVSFWIFLKGQQKKNLPEHTRQGTVKVVAGYSVVVIGEYRFFS